MIIVDTREFRSKVVKELFNKDVNIQSLQLRVGDYLIGEKICVERKSVKDFVDSLIDKRLFEQLKSIKSEYESPLLIVEGGDDIYSVRKVHPNAIRGVLASILLDFKIPIFFTKNETDTANLLITLLKRSDKTPRPILKKRKKACLSEVQLSIVESLPGLGVKNSKALLKEFKTVKSVFNASVESLRVVSGVGEKTAREIFKVASEEYKD